VNRPWLLGVDDDMRATPRPDVLLLDSHDSFTFNLAHQIAELGCGVAVTNADDVSADDVLAAPPALVVIGPGPRGPTELPHLVELVRALDGRVPLFGVCLGLQVIVRARGGSVERAKAPVHGKRWPITHDDVGCLQGLPSPLWVMRYHSLTATEVPASLRVTARDEHGQAMAILDGGGQRAFAEAVQFHPESIGTAGGGELMASVLARAGLRPTVRPRPGAVPPPSSRGPGFDADADDRLRSPSLTT
jgi:anthranilate synthase/aminodeoxychorismate synthase-like glutamine amidotransferase